MTSFEFVLVSVGIILGFGISEILAGWGRQIRHRRELTIYPLQIAASAYVLILSLRYLWAFWFIRVVDWTYAGYITMLVPALGLALAAQIMRVETNTLRRTPQEQYFESARPFFLLLGLFPVFSLLNTLMWNETVRATYGVGMPLRLVGAWVLQIGICAVLARSRRPLHHAIGLAILHLGMLIVSARVMTTLAATP